MVAHQEVVPVPKTLWLTCAILTASAVLLRWFVYRQVIGCSTRDAFGAVLASKALSRTVAMASLRGLISRTMAWRRTNKFSTLPSRGRALASTRPELALAAVTLAVTVGLAAALPHSGFVVFLAIGGLLQAGRYLSSPLLALIAERDLTRRSVGGCSEMTSAASSQSQPGAA